MLACLRFQLGGIPYAVVEPVQHQGFEMPPAHDTPLGKVLLAMGLLAKFSQVELYFIELPDEPPGDIIRQNFAKFNWHLIPLLHQVRVRQLDWVFKIPASVEKFDAIASSIWQGGR